MLHLSNKRKGKEILNNNLAVLPSHDILGLKQALFIILRMSLELIIDINYYDLTK